jgi:hypothetical protein
MFHLLVMLLLFAIGLPWNIGTLILLWSVGALAIAAPLPMACYRGHPPPTGDWALLEKMLIFSLAAGGFFNGCILAWMLTRPKTGKDKIAYESRRPNE